MPFFVGVGVLSKTKNSEREMFVFLGCLYSAENKQRSHTITGGILRI